MTTIASLAVIVIVFALWYDARTLPHGQHLALNLVLLGLLISALHLLNPHR